MSDLIDIERKMDLYKSMFYCNVPGDRYSCFLNLIMLLTRRTIISGSKGASWSCKIGLENDAHRRCHIRISWLFVSPKLVSGFTNHSVSSDMTSPKVKCVTLKRFRFTHLCRSKFWNCLERALIFVLQRPELHQSWVTKNRADGWRVKLGPTRVHYGKDGAQWMERGAVHSFFQNCLKWVAS